MFFGCRRIRASSLLCIPCLRGELRSWNKATANSEGVNSESDSTRETVDACMLVIYTRLTTHRIKTESARLKNGETIFLFF